MNQYQFILEPYSGMKSRYICPMCEKPRQFTRYIHLESKESIADNVGRCNREVQCGYHYTPKQYFGENANSNFREVTMKDCQQNLIKPDIQKRKRQRNLRKLDYSIFFQSSEAAKKSFSTIEPRLLEMSLTHYTQNNFVLYLHTLLDEETVIQLVNRYRIGTSKHWKGATVFWQVDQQKRIRSGKIMLYNASTGKRVKQPYNHITWAHKALKLANFSLQQCLFGEHLLSEEPTKIVAITESEKTAMIASAYLPEFLWLASGSLNNLTQDRCKPLADRPVVLFPDVGAYAMWKEKGQQLGFQVSDLLERYTSEESKKQGYDLADYFIKLQFTRRLTFVNIYGKSCTNIINKHGYPASWDNPIRAIGRLNSSLP